MGTPSSSGAPSTLLLLSGTPAPMLSYSRQVAGCPGDHRNQHGRVLGGALRKAPHSRRTPAGGRRLLCVSASVCLSVPPSQDGGRRDVCVFSVVSRRLGLRSPPLRVHLMIVCFHRGGCCTFRVLRVWGGGLGRGCLCVSWGRCQRGGLTPRVCLLACLLAVLSGGRPCFLNSSHSRTLS